MNLDILSSISPSFIPSDFSLFKRENGKEPLKSEIVDLIFLGAAGLVFIVLILSIAGAQGISKVFSNGSALGFFIPGAIALLGGLIWLISLSGGEKREWATALVALGMVMMLIGVSFGSVQSYKLFEKGDKCIDVFESDPTQFDSYADQLKCISGNPKLLMLTVIMFFVLGTVLWALLPGKVEMIGWAFAAVLTLYLMRRDIFLKSFGVFVEAVFGHIFLVMLLIGIIGGYIFYKERERKQMEKRIEDLKAAR